MQSWKRAGRTARKSSLTGAAFPQSCAGACPRAARCSTCGTAATQMPKAQHRCVAILPHDARSFIHYTPSNPQTRCPVMCASKSWPRLLWSTQRQKPDTAIQVLLSVPFWYQTKARIMRTQLLRSFGITCSNRDEMLCYHESWMANDCIELNEALHAAGREQRPAHGEVAQLLQNSHPPLLLDLGQGNQIYSHPIAVNVIEQ